MSLQLLQAVVLKAYQFPLVRKFTQTRFGSAIFVTSYDLYKEYVEVPGNQALSRRVSAKSWVIDIGANIGFFTERFAKWTSQGGRVIAVEPDSHNIALLKRRLNRRMLNLVDIHQAAAAEQSGTVYLQRNLDHPGDHRIANSGEPVDAVTIDQLVEQAGDPDVSLIKIDTQGSERRVLRGASKTLQRCKPALFIELDDQALRQDGTSAREIVDELSTLQYQFFRISKRGREVPLSPDEVVADLAAEKRGYIDLVCVHPSR